MKQVSSCIIVAVLKVYTCIQVIGKLIKQRSESAASHSLNHVCHKHGLNKCRGVLPMPKPNIIDYRRTNWRTTLYSNSSTRDFMYTYMWWNVSTDPQIKVDSIIECMHVLMCKLMLWWDSLSLCYFVSIYFHCFTTCIYIWVRINIYTMFKLIRWFDYCYKLYLRLFLLFYLIEHPVHPSSVFVIS